MGCVIFLMYPCTSSRVGGAWTTGVGPVEGGGAWPGGEEVVALGEELEEVVERREVGGVGWTGEAADLAGITGTEDTAPESRNTNAQQIQVPSAQQIQVPSAQQIQVPSAQQIQVPSAQQIQVPSA